VVEHSLGKGEVDSSILSGSTRTSPNRAVASGLGDRCSASLLPGRLIKLRRSEQHILRPSGHGCGAARSPALRARASILSSRSRPWPDVLFGPRAGKPIVGLADGTAAFPPG